MHARSLTRRRPVERAHEEWSCSHSMLIEGPSARIERIRRTGGRTRTRTVLPPGGRKEKQRTARREREELVGVVGVVSALSPVSQRAFDLRRRTDGRTDGQPSARHPGREIEEETRHNERCRRCPSAKILRKDALPAVPTFLFNQTKRNCRYCRCQVLRTPISHGCSYNIRIWYALYY